MSERDPIPRAVMAHHLAHLLQGHGVRSTLRAADILVEGDSKRWARLVTSSESGSNGLRLHVQAMARCGSVVYDWVNGFGADLESSLNDALLQFCVADFHVFLAALWGLLEVDQVDHHLVTAESGEWDVYLGPWVSRKSNPDEEIPPPVQAFVAALIRDASRILTERRTTAGRVFVAAHEGEMAYEALLDGEPNTALEALLRSLPLAHSVRKYASQRLFFIAVPHDGVAAHGRTSRRADPSPKR